MMMVRKSNSSDSHLIDHRAGALDGLEVFNGVKGARLTFLLAFLEVLEYYVACCKTLGTLQHREESIPVSSGWHIDFSRLPRPVKMTSCLSGKSQ